jgi:hypothetical protein
MCLCVPTYASSSNCVYLRCCFVCMCVGGWGAPVRVPVWHGLHGLHGGLHGQMVNASGPVWAGARDPYTMILAASKGYTRCWQIDIPNAFHCNALVDNLALVSWLTLLLLLLGCSKQRPGCAQLAASWASAAVGVRGAPQAVRVTHATTACGTSYT